MKDTAEYHGKDRLYVDYNNPNSVKALMLVLQRSAYFSFALSEKSGNDKETTVALSLHALAVMCNTLGLEPCEDLKKILGDVVRDETEKKFGPMSKQSKSVVIIRP